LQPEPRLLEALLRNLDSELDAMEHELRCIGWNPDGPGRGVFAETRESAAKLVAA